MATYTYGYERAWRKIIPQAQLYSQRSDVTVSQLIDLLLIANWFHNLKGVKHLVNSGCLQWLKSKYNF